MCPRDGTVLLASFSVRDEETTHVDPPANPWGEEPPTRGAAPSAWGEEAPPRSNGAAQGSPYSHSGAQVVQWGEEPPTRDQLIGMKLGEYELRSRIGVGGMGFVYDGIQPLIGKRVAVKVLRPELAQAPEQVARLLAEARAVNAIRHRGIIDIFGFGQVPDGRQYIVMEFLDGQPLDAYMAEKGRLPATEALSILDEVLAALGAAHGAGVVHRDLKPSNIFLVKEPGGTRYVKLLDFGLAKQGQSGGAGRTAQTRTDMVVGTPEYMAPEQARGQAVGPMTDLYAMGVVTFEMVTGRLPFIGTSPVDLLMKHVDARPPRPSEFMPELPPALDAFILQMLTKDPEARPGSADALRQQLHRLRRTMLRPTRAQTAAANGAAGAARTPTPEPSKSTEPGTPPVLEPQAPALTAPEPATSPAAPMASEAATSPNEAVKATPPPTPRPTPGEPSQRELTAAEAQAAGVRSPLRRLLPVGLGAAALVAAVAVLLSRDEDPKPPVVNPPVIAQPDPTPPPVNPPPVNPPPVTPPVTPPVNPVTPPTTAQTPTSPPDAPPVATPPNGTPPGTETGKTVAQDATENPGTGKTRPRPPVNSVNSNVPSRAVLLSTIEGLERDLDARAAAGENMTSARNMLKTLRTQAREARDVDSRLSVARNIASWEKAYLKRR